jgi:hypothetical protein
MVSVLFTALTFGAETPRPTKTGERLQEWDVVAESGIIRFVYVSPDGLKDKFFVAQLLQAIVSKAARTLPIEILLFDDRRYTPRAFPMTDAQMLHWKARYNSNPNRDFEEFVWVSVTNSKASPPKLKETRAKIRPGFAE